MAWVDKGRYYTYGVKSTLADIDSITGMVAGETVFCGENNRRLTYDGDVWMCSDFVKLTNGNATVAMSRGDCVRVGTTAFECVHTTASGEITALGIVAFGAAAGSPVAVAILGVYDAFSDTAVTRGYYLIADATDGRADATSTMTTGRFGVFVEGTGANGLAKAFIKTKMESN